MIAQPGLCRTWSETPKTGFLTTRLICVQSEIPEVSILPSIMFENMWENVFIPPVNCVCGRVYCFHVVRPSERPTVRMCVRNVLFP